VDTNRPNEPLLDGRAGYPQGEEAILGGTSQPAAKQEEIYIMWLIFSTLFNRWQQIHGLSLLLLQQIVFFITEK